MVRQLSDAQLMYNPKDCFRSPSAPIMLLWRNGSAAVAILELLESAGCRFKSDGKLLYLYPCRLTERPGGYEPSEACSIHAGDTVAVAERLCSGL